MLIRNDDGRRGYFVGDPETFAVQAEQIIRTGLPTRNQVIGFQGIQTDREPGLLQHLDGVGQVWKCHPWLAADVDYIRAVAAIVFSPLQYPRHAEEWRLDHFRKDS